MNNLFEGLKENDLARLIRDDIFIDEYSSKMGENKDVITTSFKITDREPANDLVSFLEKSYDFILDADVSQGEKTDGDYLVFFEVERTTDYPQQLMTILQGVSQLSGISEWNFKYKNSDNKYPASKLTITEKVPLTPQLFNQHLEESQWINKYKSIARVPATGSWDFYDSVKLFKGSKK